MTLKIYNTKTRQKEVFQPLVADQVKMYVCGPTVYNFVHIGNARPVVVFDTLFRLLQTQFKDVTYARNITDIDDKIMNTAAEQGIEISELAATFAAEFEYDMAELNNLPPSITPYATDHLPEMIAMVERLIEKGHAYASEGHVLFAVGGTMAVANMIGSICGVKMALKYGSGFIRILFLILVTILIVRLSYQMFFV